MESTIHIHLEGDDFRFEADITMLEAGHIIQYVGSNQERRKEGKPVL